MKKLLFALFCFIASLSFCNDTGYQKIEDQSNLTILNPFLANRKISKIQLSNGLKAYIISDKNADRSAAALAVNAGYWNDPIQYEGMAHFCEHMLFKGSKAYPSETDYFHFMFDNSANVNAFTSFDKTVYGFSIHNEIFKEALDRLSHFFIDPLFKEGEIAKELYAVDQEHSKNIENDGWRFFMILKELSSKDHPFSKFSTGTSETLSRIPPSELRKWYENYYNANNMALVVYSPLELDELTSLGMEKFEQVPNKSIEPLSIPDTLFTEETRGHFIYIKPFADLQELNLVFELPKDFALDEDKSLKLIAYTLQRGQSYSLLEALKKEQLAESVDISAENLSQKHALFSINIELTNQGMANTDLVIQRCFEAINNLKQNGVPEYIYSEMKKMRELNYQYQPQIDAFSFAMHHAYDILDEEFSTYPRKTILPTTYNPKKISVILEKLTPKMARYFLACDPKKINISLDKKEKWMKAEYSIKEIAEEKLTSWQNALNPNIKTPEINSFIPTKLELCPSTTDTATFDKPLKLLENEKGVLFFAKDNKYLTPEISWHFIIKDALFDLNPKTYALKDLYVKALFEKLQSTIFSAESAGLRVKFFTADFDFILLIDGYSEKATTLLEEVLNQIKTFSMTESEFDTHKNSLTLDYENSQKELPYVQALNLLQNIVKPSEKTSLEKLKALKELTFENFSSFQKELFKKCYINAFLTGNMNVKDAEKAWLDINSTLGEVPFDKEEHFQKMVISLSDKGPFSIIKPTTCMGTGIVLAIDEGSFSFKTRAVQQILSSAIKEPFFTALRSEQKTSYIAASTDSEEQNKLFQLFFVQSNSHSPNDLLTRFEIFIDSFLQNINKNIDETRFEKIKTAIITKLKNPPKNLQEMSDKLTFLAFDKQEDFAFFEKRISALQELSYKEFLSLAPTFLSKENKKRISVAFKGLLPKDKQFAYEEIDPEKLLESCEYAK